MANANEATLRNAAFGRGDVQPMLDSLADDIKWHVSGRSPLAGEYTGKQEVLSFFGKMMEMYKGNLRLEVLDVLANGRHGIALTKEHGEYAGRQFEFQERSEEHT